MTRASADDATATALADEVAGFGRGFNDVHFCRAL